jgi:hypothetical protein
MQLLRNCSHGSEIATYLAGEGPDRKVIKTASTSSGIKFLLAEVAGWNWYQRMRYQHRTTSVCRIVRQSDKYIRIEIVFIKGNKVDVGAGLEKNAEVVKRAIEHYCAVWPGEAEHLVPFHGDLSVDNIIFNDNGLHFIDWEHFNPSGAFWGFDVLYLIFETLWFGMRTRLVPTDNEVALVRECLGMLDSDKRFRQAMVQAPLRQIRDFISANPHLWGEQLAEFPGKLPVLQFSDEQVRMIDSEIAKGARA